MPLGCPWSHRLPFLFFRCLFPATRRPFVPLRFSATPSWSTKRRSLRGLSEKSLFSSGNFSPFSSLTTMESPLCVLSFSCDESFFFGRAVSVLALGVGASFPGPTFFHQDPRFALPRPFLCVFFPLPRLRSPPHLLNGHALMLPRNKCISLRPRPRIPKPTSLLVFFFLRSLSLP